MLIKYIALSLSDERGHFSAERAACRSPALEASDECASAPHVIVNKMVNDRRRRYDAELSAIETDRLSQAAAAMLKGEKAHERFSNLAELKNQEPLSPPLILSTYPSFGAFPSFEEAGIIL